MNPDLQNKIDLEAERVATLEAKPMLKDMWKLSSRGQMKDWFHHFFLLGSQFVQGILQPEIDRLKLGHKNLNDVNDNAASDINKLNKENQRLRDAIRTFLNDECVRPLEKALTHKAEE